MRHSPFRIGYIERDAWLRCMHTAVAAIDSADPRRRHTAQQLLAYLEMAAALDGELAVLTQQLMLARVFGCAQVVFNDALRIRNDAYRAGMKLSDTEIQRRVITAAKTTAERAWLCEVPSVALVQSVNDSRRAWRNFFDSVRGKRKGPKVGRPRFKSRKDHRQSFRLTRNGFDPRQRRVVRGQGRRGRGSVVA